MEILEEAEFLNESPEPTKIIEGFKKLTEQRYLLVKRGKVFKRLTYRYFTFINDHISYYISETSKHEKGKISLHKSIAIPLLSPILRFSLCIKIITPSSSEFFIFCKDNEEQEMMMYYIKLCSNNMLQAILDKICFTAVDHEFQTFNMLNTPKNLRSENFLTPKNVISRFLFSPSSELNLDPPEENIMIRLPRSVYHEEKDCIPECDETLVEIQELNTKKINFLEHIELPEFRVIEKGSIDEIRELGVKYLWNYQLEFAKNTFDGIRHNDLRSALHCVEICLFRVLITGRKSDIKSSMEELEYSQKACSCKNEIHIDILNAELMLFKAFINLRNSWKTYKKYESSQIFDTDIRARIELGLGIFLLLISLSPVSVSTILRLAGFSSNREEGLSHLFKCIEYNSSHSPYAAIILSLYYTDLDPDIKKATEIIDNFINVYPGCVLFHWVKSIISWKNNQIESAVSNLDRALYYCGEELSTQAAFIKYELGWFYFLRFEWDLARKQFESILLDTLSLSSELDELVKQLLNYGKLQPEQEKILEEMLRRKKTSKKKSNNWLESEKTPDRVYLPHKSCLITQFVCCLSAVNIYDEIWLKIIQISSNYPNSHSSLDEDFGALSQSYLNRKSTILMPFEVIYFMKQHTKLLSYMLTKIYSIASDVITRINLNNKDEYAEYCSARMIQIMSLALNGDTILAIDLCKVSSEAVDKLPSWAIYIAPHLLYWCSRVYIAEGNKKIAEVLLKKAKKYKKYIFDISLKIEKVITDLL